jgi:hypothetical protein
VVVSRDGSRLFLYAATAEQSREAERVVRELVAADDLTAEFSTTRWHPIEQAWEDAAAPLPVTSEEIAEERSRLEEAERHEAERESWDWHVESSYRLVKTQWSSPRNSMPKEIQCTAAGAT